VGQRAGTIATSKDAEKASTAARIALDVMKPVSPEVGSTAES